MKNIILLISLLICAQISFAQDTKPTLEVPKIGLVLSGGGAKGLAHIGVLKVIDSLGVKIDYIGGTSMGAIIGGLYASGYSGEELEALFNTIDVDALLQDFTPRNSKTFYEKRNDEIYAVTLPFKNFKIGLPSALSKGLYNFNLLSRLTLHVSEVNDFAKLPIPFFCIATDVESGEEVILDKGVLSKAMVASGALPTLYNPIEINGVLLIDGGVVNNYPVEELKRRGADIVIGVDVQDALKSRSQLQDVTSLLGQINNYSMVEKMTKKIQKTDIYIKPDIKGYNVISFDKVKELIPRGEIAAREMLEKSFVKKYLKKDKDTQKIVNLDSIYINKIGVSSLDNYTRSFVIGKLKFKENKTISFKQFEKGINNLNATQNFSSVFYSFQTAGNGKNLFLDLKEQKINRFLKFGLHYDGLFKSGVLINFTQKKMFTKNDVFSLDFILGDNFRYNFNYYIDNGFYWSFGINSKYFAFNKNTPTGFNNGSVLTDLGINSINIDYSDLSNQLYLQTIFAQKLSIGAGVELKHLKLKSETLQATNPVFDKSDYLSFFGYMKFDSFDQKNFPKKGGYFNGEIKSFVYSSDYNKTYENFSIAKGDMAIIQTFFKKISVKVQSEGGFTIGERSIDFLDFAIGGFGFTNVNNIRPFYGYDYIGLVGDSYVKGGIEGDYEFVKKHHLNFTANFANIGDNIFENDTWISKPKYSGYAIGYGMESILGPIEIKHTWSPETKKHYTWFSLGFSF